MTGLTFHLNKNSESTLNGQSSFGWPEIAVTGRAIWRVERSARERRPEHIDDTEATTDYYEYMLHCVCTTSRGDLEYTSIIESEFEEEVAHGIYTLTTFEDNHDDPSKDGHRADRP